MKEVKESGAHNQFRMVTGLLMRREDCFKTKSEQESLEKVMFLAVKEKALIKVDAPCKMGTNVSVGYEVAHWERGDCQLLDTRHPSVKNSMRVDAKSSKSIFGLSVRNKRKLYQEEGERYFDRVKRIATEGTMLTFIGKISYHADTDSFTIRDNVGFIGGGAKEALVVLKERYTDWMSGSKLCFAIGACLFGVAAAWEWHRRLQRAN